MEDSYATEAIQGNRVFFSSCVFEISRNPFVTDVVAPTGAEATIGPQIDIQPYKDFGWFDYSLKTGIENLVVEDIQKAHHRG